jgi:hypothetical protein
VGKDTYLDLDEAEAVWLRRLVAGHGHLSDHAFSIYCKLHDSMGVNDMSEHARTLLDDEHSLSTIDYNSEGIRYYKTAAFAQIVIGVGSLVQAAAVVAIALLLFSGTAHATTDWQNLEGGPATYFGPGDTRANVCTLWPNAKGWCVDVTDYKPGDNGSDNGGSSGGSGGGAGGPGGGPGGGGHSGGPGNGNGNAGNTGNGGGNNNGSGPGTGNNGSNNGQGNGAGNGGGGAGNGGR